MKGLIVKDFYILCNQKTLMALGVLCGVICLFTMKDPGFLICYVTLIATSVGCATCSYDEMNNGMAYLMTLPVKRTSYVLEKYLFATGCGLVGYVFSVLFGFIYYFATKNLDLSSLFENMIFLPVLVFTIPAIMIPTILKFGSAKSRIVIFILMGMLFAFGGIMSLLNVVSFTFVTEGEITVTFMENAVFIQQGWVLLGSVAISILIFIGSILLSIGIIKKKDF